MRGNWIKSTVARLFTIQKRKKSEEKEEEKMKRSENLYAAEIKSMSGKLLHRFGKSVLARQRRRNLLTIRSFSLWVYGAKLLENREHKRCMIGKRVEYRTAAFVVYVQWPAGIMSEKLQPHIY